MMCGSHDLAVATEREIGCPGICHQRERENYAEKGGSVRSVLRREGGICQKCTANEVEEGYHVRNPQILHMEVLRVSAHAKYIMFACVGGVHH